MCCRFVLPHDLEPLADYLKEATDELTKAYTDTNLDKVTTSARINPSPCWP